ncbi:ankyrin repeat domain-containing protein [Fusarium napiforme]|uniref:Ankyrin repeat domain-containing protein n=1 Tax=Fusarium napiforme TaxID=42672 RepID=A0A8H5K7Z8_9HYPO|nr:ankyrin repeat domain-containing protein [Fusarium napiforme]
MPVSTLSCPPCRKAKKKARKRKSAATDVDDDKASDYLLLEAFWLERLTQYSKSALTIQRETRDRLDLLPRYEPREVREVLGQIEENRALVRPKIEACEDHALRFATEDKDMFGRSLLHLALDLGVGDDALHLLSCAANKPDSWDRLPLHIASFTGCIDLVTRLICDQAGIQMKDIWHLQPLHYASAAGHLDIVNLLIDKVEIDPRDLYSRTPLFFAAKNGHVATATMLLDNGANIEKGDLRKWTPLLHAINRGRMGMVDLLLRKGAQVKPMMETQILMLDPLSERHLGVIKLLLDHGSVEEIRRFSRENLLLWAAKMQDHNLARQLILHKVFRTPIDTNGITALSYAAEEGNHEIVVELLENGVNPNERCSGRELPLSYAVAGGHVSVTKELLQHNADPNAKSGIDMDGQMVIAKAYELRNSDIIDHLVAWGADVSANGSRGWTPVFPAVAEGI